MTTRILPPDEWERLAGTDAGALLPSLHPARTFPVVVEIDGEIVACHLLLWTLHAECLWVHPHYRKTTVGGRLWRAVKAAAQAFGAPQLVTASTSDEVTRLLMHVHAKQLPGDHYAIPL